MLKKKQSPFDEYDNNPTNDMDDRYFLDMMTNPYYNSKEYYQKFSEMEASKNQDVYNNYQQYIDKEKRSKKS